MRPWGDNLCNLNVHIVAIVRVISVWGLVLGAKLFSLDLNLAFLTFFVLDHQSWRGGVSPRVG